MAVLIVPVPLSPNSLWLFTLSTSLGSPGLAVFQFARIHLLAGDEAPPKTAVRILSRTRCPANNSRRKRDCDHCCCNINHDRAKWTPDPSGTGDDAPIL